MNCKTKAQVHFAICTQPYLNDQKHSSQQKHSKCADWSHCSFTKLNQMLFMSI